MTIYSHHQWTPIRGGTLLLKVGALALALVALMSILVLLSSRPASAQTPTADYRFQGTLKSSVVGAPDLANIGPGTNTFTTTTVDGTSTKVLSFPQGNGVMLSRTTDVISNGGTYTIVALFKLDSVSGYRRIIDFKNGTSDNGLYVHDGKLEFYRGTSGTAAGTGAPIAANTYVQVVLTRDASTRVVTGYVDGVQQFSFSDNRAFTDSANDAVIDSSNALRFFRDNESGTEHSAGSVARIRLYGAALSDTEVGKLDRLEPTYFVVNSINDDPDSEPRDGRCDAYAAITGDQCTLRAAIHQANRTSEKDTINFSSALNFSTPRTITLTKGELDAIEDDTAGEDLIIQGPGARKLAVSGNNASSVFAIDQAAGATINDLTIKNGSSLGTLAGGIYIHFGGTLTLNNSTVSGNKATGEGGGIYNDRGTLTLDNSTLSGNTAGDQGGGIANEYGRLTINNSTLSNNTANGSGGGGVSIRSHTLTVTNATISGNKAPNGKGGGILIDPELPGSATLRNTIVAGNSAPQGPDAYGTFDSPGFNLIGNTSGSGGWVTSDIKPGPGQGPINPLLGPLQNNGGTTDTHAIWPGSPAIDSGNPAQTGSGGNSCLAKDQRGVTRPKDGDNTGTLICDIGAYERNDLTSPQVSSTTPPAGGTGVSRGANLTATFSEQMTRSTLNTTTFKLFKVNSDGSTTQISSWTVSSSTDGLNATLNPFGTSTTLLLANTKYKAVVTTGARGLAGNQLDQNPTLVSRQQKEWTFTTGST